MFLFFVSHYKFSGVCCFCFVWESHGVRITPELQKEEKEAVDNRKTQVVMSLNKLGIKADEVRLEDIPEGLVFDPTVPGV
jgi:hypothetical protein